MNMYELIVAVDINYGISKNGNIPWHIPEELKFFVYKTQYHTVFMGKNTYFSIPEKNRPLKNRFNIVYTKNPEKYINIMQQHGNVLFTDDESILPNYSNVIIPHNTYSPIFIIGGSQIYNQFYDKCNVIWLTQIKKNYYCDIKLDIIKILSNFVLDEVVDDNNEYVIEKYIRIV
jgi:dihydrofolate reductase